MQRGAAGPRASLPASSPRAAARAGRPAPHASTTATSWRDDLRFSNWPLYIDYDEETKKRPTLDQFTQTTGIKVDYIEEINDNAQYFGKIQGALSQGRSIDRDIIVLTDNSRVPGPHDRARLGGAARLDLHPEHVQPDHAQQSPPFDPDREYSLPWQSGMTGIAWNEDVTGPVESVDAAPHDPALKGKVTMLMESPTRSVSSCSRTATIRDGHRRAFDEAIDTIQRAVDSGQIRKFTGNDYAQPLTKGDIAAAVAWSGDVVQLLASNPKLKWAIPKDRRDDLDGQHAHPDRRQRRHGVRRT